MILGKHFIVLAAVLLILGCSDVAPEACPYSIQDFGRIPRQTAEAAAGLYGSEAKGRAMDANSTAWQIYERAYENTLADMRKECPSNQ